MARTNAVWRTKEVPCTVCGEPIIVGLNARKPKRCLECGIKKAADTAREIKQRSGPGYEAWLAGNARYAALARGGTQVVSDSTNDDATS